MGLIIFIKNFHILQAFFSSSFFRENNFTKIVVVVNAQMICLQTIKSAFVCFFHDNVAQNNSGFFVLFIFFITPKRKNYNIFSEIFECCSQFWVSLKARASRFYNFLNGCLDNFQMICCTIIPIKTAKMVNPKTITAAL